MDDLNGRLVTCHGQIASASSIQPEGATVRFLDATALSVTATSPTNRKAEGSLPDHSARRHLTRL